MADNSIQLQLIDKKEPMQRFLYNEAYKFWQAQWTETIEELGLEGLSVKHSDKFLAADKIIVFREGVNIAALGLINYIDLQLLASRFLSYLGVMTEESMAFILSQGYRKVRDLRKNKMPARRAEPSHPIWAKFQNVARKVAIVLVL